jgi:predicted permease
MGLPVSYYAFGDPGLLYASVFMAFLVPLVNLLSVISLGMFAGRSSVLVVIKNSLFNPLAIGCFLGLAASYTNMVFPEFVSRTLVIVSGVTLPLALFCIGASLTLRQLNGNILIIFLSSGFKLLIMPALVLILLSLFDQPIDTMAKVLVVMAASPSATVNYILAATMGGDVDSTSGTIVITTLLSIFTYVFWLSRLGL